MRALLFHCKNYRIKIDKLANRLKDIMPEEVNEKEKKSSDCIVILITIEKGDEIEKVSNKLIIEVQKMSEDVGSKNVVLLPFAHLSNNLATSEEAIRAIKLVEEILINKYEVVRSHFGSHKSLLLDTYGHPGNVRYREF